MTAGDNDIRESTEGARFDSPGRSPGKRPRNNGKPQRGEIRSGGNSCSLAALMDPNVTPRGSLALSGLLFFTFVNPGLRPGLSNLAPLGLLAQNPGRCRNS